MLMLAFSSKHHCAKVQPDWSASMAAHDRFMLCSILYFAVPNQDLLFLAAASVTWTWFGCEKSDMDQKTPLWKTANIIRNRSFHMVILYKLFIHSTYRKCALLWYGSLSGYEMTDIGIRDFGHVAQPHMWHGNVFAPQIGLFSLLFLQYESVCMRRSVSSRHNGV